MAERPGPLRQLDRYFAAATIAHEYIADLHQELVMLEQDTDQTRRLLHESAEVVLSRMPDPRASCAGWSTSRALSSSTSSGRNRPRAA
jgi:hypothetical protein